tara:strand:- start:12639 stop:13259 length:621 start_codon:yes stop_codon:yes gene_type:complete
MNNTAIEKSNVTAANVISKLNSLSKNSPNSSTIPKQLTMTPPESAPKSLTSHFITIIRYIVIIYLVLYIGLVILNQLDLLPSGIANIFKPFDFVSLLSIKKEEPQKEDTTNLATAIEPEKEEDKPKTVVRPEVIPPTPLPQAGNPLPEPDEASSRTQVNHATKGTYCYIGEDRGFRSCVKIEDGEKCMSGDIFPTQAVCINPNLRP